MKWSHSKLNTAMTCTMTYYLNYVQGIQLKREKSAFSIGSAVHWGLEHNTDDLTPYWEENFRTSNNYTSEMIMAEGMVHGYLLHKDRIMNEVFKDPDDPTQRLELLDEEHELEIWSKLKSYKFDAPHDFMGIIDLLFMTNKGWVLIDYKTSSTEPDWNKYLEQVYRYIYLLKNAFPDVPVCKIGIINLKKASIRMKNGENDISFLQRLKQEYDVFNEKYIGCHMYLPSELDMNIINNYFHNLSKMADTAQFLIENKMFFINFNNAVTVYGKSDYWDIFYKTKDCYLLYKIRDLIFDEDTKTFVYSRDCNQIDMETIDDEYIGNDKIINHYEDYRRFLNSNEDLSKHIIDENLKKIYDTTYKYENIVKYVINKTDDINLIIDICKENNINVDESFIKREIKLLEKEKETENEKH